MKERGTDRQRAHVQAAQKALQKPVDGEKARRRAAAAHESRADKALRPGSPEHRAAVARRSGR